MAHSVTARYAEAIVGVARSENALERVSDELFRFARALAEHTELRDRLTDPGVDISDKLGITSELLAGRAHPQTVAALLYVIQAGRARLLGEIASQVVEQAAAIRGRGVAEVRVAAPIDDDRRRRLAAAIEHATGKKIDMKVIVDPDLVGGVSVRVGDTVIDGSVARRLGELKARLVGS
ncbi:MAG: ATP synthase F1 subunit delta [Egibacteraceae bacterium]